MCHFITLLNLPWSFFLSPTPISQPMRKNYFTIGGNRNLTCFSQKIFCILSYPLSYRKIKVYCFATDNMMNNNPFTVHHHPQIKNTNKDDYVHLYRFGLNKQLAKFTVTRKLGISQWKCSGPLCQNS